MVLDSTTLMHEMFNRVQRSRNISSDVSWLNHSLTQCPWFLGIVEIPFKCCPPRVWTYCFQKFSRPFLSMEVNHPLKSENELFLRCGN